MIYVYGPPETGIEQISSGGTVTYLHHDQQGSTRLLTGSTGTVTGSTTFDAYGNKTGSTGTSTTPLGYDAQYTSSDTGLIYMRARVYDSATAQFLSSDPLKAITGEPYAYAGDNPLTYSDPTGLSFGSFLQEVGEGIVGWGDTITFGATNWAREELGINNVDTCSGTYQAGGYAGLVTAALIPGEGEAELGAEGASLDLSQHAIQRMAERGGRAAGGGGVCGGGGRRRLTDRRACSQPTAISSAWRASMAEASPLPLISSAKPTTRWVSSAVASRRSVCTVVGCRPLSILEIAE